MSRQPKYAKKVDGNQQEIVDALRQAGCTVVVLGDPLDLLVGHRNFNLLLECKNPDTDYGKNDRSTDTQRKFFKNWKGQKRKVETAEEAIHYCRNVYRHYRGDLALVTGAYNGRQD